MRSSSFSIYISLNLFSYSKHPQLNEALSDRQGQGPGEALDYALRQEQEQVGSSFLVGFATADNDWCSPLAMRFQHRTNTDQSAIY
jgi:hypothetical protein